LFHIEGLDFERLAERLEFSILFWVAAAAAAAAAAVFQRRYITAFATQINHRFFTEWSQLLRDSESLFLVHANLRAEGRRLGGCCAGAAWKGQPGE